MAKTQTKLTRIERADIEHYKGMRPEPVTRGLWAVFGTHEYKVSKETDGTFSCTCPDALYRSHQGELCKHILEVILAGEPAPYEAPKVALVNNPVESSRLDVHLKPQMVVF
jgi:hypothetical protein